MEEKEKKAKQREKVRLEVIKPKHKWCPQSDAPTEKKNVF
jgi:hypothetical protein